jgi:fatty acid desaturase
MYLQRKEIMKIVVRLLSALINAATVLGLYYYFGFEPTVIGVLVWVLCQLDDIRSDTEKERG